VQSIGAELSSDQHLKKTRSVQQRYAVRVARLRSLLQQGGGRPLDEQAAWARHTIWEKQQPQAIRVREGLVLREGREISYLREVSASKSAAVQLLLLSIFENQCRAAAPDSHRTPVPLREADPETETAWLYLTALPITDRTAELTHARSPAENRLQQVRNALDRLERFRRIDFAGNDPRDRHEHFSLLNEAKHNRGGSVLYKAPAPDEETIDIPVAFFTSGWVHALEDNEIVAYLFLLHQAKRRPAENNGEGMPLTRFGWSAAFGTSRAYGDYRLLSRFGLIRFLHDPNRSATGRVAGLGETPGRRPATEPHRFWVDYAGLNNLAVPTVIDGLERYIDGEDLDKANWGSDPLA
jgi:hypothetical protein